MIYDDSSTDSVDEELKNTPGVIIKSMEAFKKQKLGRQKAAYLEARDFLGSLRCDWIGYMDVDEYVVNLGQEDGLTLASFLKRQPKQVTSVALSHGDFTVHHRSANNGSLYCPNMPKVCTPYSVLYCFLPAPFCLSFRRAFGSSPRHNFLHHTYVDIARERVQYA